MTLFDEEKMLSEEEKQSVVSKEESTSTITMKKTVNKDSLGKMKKSHQKENKLLTFKKRKPSDGFPNIRRLFQNNQKEKRPMAKKSIAALLPIIDQTEDGFFELKDDMGYLEIRQITSKDVYSMNEQEIEFDVGHFAHFLQAYQLPHKFVSMNFPVSTLQQQEFITKKINGCKNPLSKKFLYQKLKELQFLEWGRSNREYFIFIFGENEHLLKDNIQSVSRLLKRTMEVYEIDEEKKLNILLKLYNQNSKLGKKMIEVKK